MTRPDTTQADPPMIRPGMTLAERRAARQQLEEFYLEQARIKARVSGRSMRCGQYVVWYGDTNHSLCRGEEMRAGGCLCECHDPNEDQQ